MLRHRNHRTKTTECLIGGIVNHLLNDVQRIFGARVHPRTLFDRLQSFEDADVGFYVMLAHNLILFELNNGLLYRKGSINTVGREIKKPCAMTRLKFEKGFKKQSFNPAPCA